MNKERGLEAHETRMRSPEVQTVKKKAILSIKWKTWNSVNAYKVFICSNVKLHFNNFIVI